MSAATLIKRFGSKQQLFLALNRRWADSIIPGLEAAQVDCRTPLARLRAAALRGLDGLDSLRPAGPSLASGIPQR